MDDKGISNICPKCNGTMEQGFILDHGDLNYRSQAHWVSGLPEKSRLTGNIKIDGKNYYPILNMRCKVCGYLESYAK